MSTLAKVFSDPPVISATPVYQPYGGGGERPAGAKGEDGDDYVFPREQINPSRPKQQDENIVTRTIGSKNYSLRQPRLKLEQLLGQERTNLVSLNKKYLNHFSQSHSS